MTHAISKPEAFLEIRVNDLAVDPSLTALCVGYEKSEWRAAQFANHVMDWLPEFALNYAELSGVHPGNMAQLMRQAAQNVYKSEKFKNRGEFGELFLHIAMRQVFDSSPAISKIYYKSAQNETVKGFDAVHVVGPPDKMELWLGEAKFYEDYKAAVRDVSSELRKHTETNFLRDEFVLISRKIDPQWPHAERLQEMLSKNRSLDEVFARACIPVLLTYDSSCLARHDVCDDGYVQAFKAEVWQAHKHFKAQELPLGITIHLILLPLHTKKALLEILDDKLKTWQEI